MPQDSLSPKFLESLLADVVQSPLEPWEANGAVNPGDPHQDPDLPSRPIATGTGRST